MQSTKPESITYPLYSEFVQLPHLLIAGVTGSGKSVTLEGILYTLLSMHSPESCQIIIIESQGDSFSYCRALPHILTYCDDSYDFSTVLQQIYDLIKIRFNKMSGLSTRQYPGSDLYVLIDDLADVLATFNSITRPLIEYICRNGRAARVHVIAATKHPTYDAIPALTRANFVGRVGLYMPSVQDSISVIGKGGCDQLSKYGQCYYLDPKGLRRCDIPMIPLNDILSLIKYWSSAAR